MESTLKKISGNKYKLTIELGHEELASYIKTVESKVSREAKIDGFRKGKAPKNLIRKEVGEEFILQEALNLALQDSSSKAIDKEGLEVLEASNLNIIENSSSKLLYSVEVAVFPAIKIGDLRGLKVIARDISVSKDEISKTLELMRSSQAKLISKDKPIEAGDKAEIDFEVTSEGLPIEGGISKNHPVIIGDNKFIPGFEDKLIGMKQGEEKEFTLSAPKDYLHKNIAGKILDFTIKITRVEQIQKPALDDNLARSLGKFNSLQDLERNIEENIREDKKDKEKQRIRAEILAGILERSKIDTPDYMIEQRLNEMIANFDNDLHAKGMELSIYLAHLKKTEDDLRKDWLPEAKKQVAFVLLLKKIAKDKNIKPLPEEIDNAVNAIIQSVASRGGELDKDSVDLGSLKEAAAGDLTNEKGFEFLEKTYSTLK